MVRLDDLDGRYLISLLDEPDYEGHVYLEKTVETDDPNEAIEVFQRYLTRARAMRAQTESILAGLRKNPPARGRWSVVQRHGTYYLRDRDAASRVHPSSRFDFDEAMPSRAEAEALAWTRNRADRASGHYPSAAPMDGFVGMDTRSGDLPMAKEWLRMRRADRQRTRGEPSGLGVLADAEDLARRTWTAQPASLRTAAPPRIDAAGRLARLGIRPTPAEIDRYRRTYEARWAMLASPHGARSERFQVLHDAARLLGHPTFEALYAHALEQPDPGRYVERLAAQHGLDGLEIHRLFDAEMAARGDVARGDVARRNGTRKRRSRTARKARRR